MYNLPIKNVQCVHHVFDVLDFLDMHPMSRNLIEKFDLFDADVLCVWATRLDHPDGKGYVKAIWLIAQMNKVCDAKLVFLNSASDSEQAKTTIRQLRDEAAMWGLPEENLIFSSAEGADWELGVPRKVVRDLLGVANLFILPSKSETFSLATIEAAACKNFLVLNDNLEVMHELVGDNAFYIPFDIEWGGIKTDVTYNPSPQVHFMQLVREILEELDQCKPLKQQRVALRKFSTRWIWENQMRELIEGD